MTTATIELGNVLHNLHQAKTLIPVGGRVYALLSADAYGHGAIPIARVLENEVDGFAVSRPSEAFELRLSGILRPIIVLSGVWTPADLRRLAREACDIVCHSEIQLTLLESVKLERPCSVWLELDLGLHTTGFRETSARICALQRLSNCANVKQPPNFVSRLSASNAPEGKLITSSEINDFVHFTRGKRGLKCLTDGGSLLLQPNEMIGETVRLGRILYGIWPLSHRYIAQRCGATREPRGLPHLDLRPAMTLKAKIICIRECRQGEAVGYDGQRRLQADTRLGVVSIGYGDGYPSNVPAGMPVWINGRLREIVDQPSMDTTIVDLGIDSIDRVGDDVILWGGKLPLHVVASRLDCAPEILCSRLTKRVTRHIAGLAELAPP